MLLWLHKGREQSWLGLVERSWPIRNGVGVPHQFFVLGNYSRLFEKIPKLEAKMKSDLIIGADKKI